MRLLFIKLKHIGDSLLLTPTLTAVRAHHPQAQIWAVVRRGCEGILAGCPAIDRILTSVEPESKKRRASNWLAEGRLIRELRQQHFDYAFELSDGDRGRCLAWLSGARMRCANIALAPLSRWWKGRFNGQSTFRWMDGHRVEKDFHTVKEFLPLGSEIPPLTFARERSELWPPVEAWGDFAVLHPGTRWMRKRWPVARWIELGRELLARIPRLIVSSGPDPEEVVLAGFIVHELGDAALSTAGSISWAQLAGLLYRARLFVGVDTAAMHLAAACQCPTVAIFGPSIDAQWRPWRVAHRVVQPEGSARSAPDETLIQLVPADKVLAACDELLRPSESASLRC